LGRNCGGHRGDARPHVTPSLILKKLSAYRQQNSLAAALREVGRIERTLFTLRWFDDTDLRRTVTAELNKGEARNSLARAVAFHRLGRFRDRGLENQQTRAAALNLSRPPSFFSTAAISVVPSMNCGTAAHLSIPPCCPDCRRWDGTASISPAIISGPRASTSMPMASCRCSSSRYRESVSE
jgi:hypothetical protein